MDLLARYIFIHENRILDSSCQTVTRWMPKIILYSEGIVRLSKSYLKPSYEKRRWPNSDPRRYLQIRSRTPYHWASDCSWRTTAELCNLCEEHVNIISTVAGPDPNPMIGDQLPHPNECNSMLMSGTRGETQTPNPNKYDSMLTSAISGYIYLYQYSLGIEYDFLFSAENWKMISSGSNNLASGSNNLPFSILNAIGWSLECVWICLVQIVKQFILSCICFKVVVHAWYWAFFVAHIFKYLVPNFVFRRSAWCLSLQFLYNWVWNLWLPTWSTTPSMLEQLPVYFYLITRRIPLDCFDKSIYSQCIICN